MNPGAAAPLTGLVADAGYGGTTIVPGGKWPSCGICDPSRTRLNVISAVWPMRCFSISGSRDARRLHDDALIALADDRDFAGAVGVDAAADDFDRLFRRLRG